MDSDCPPDGVLGYQLTTTFTIEATVESFNRAAFKQSFALLLAPVGSDLDKMLNSSPKGAPDDPRAHGA